MAVDRGAGRSAGRTSWTAKPEIDDYTSFAAFLVYYVHYLDPFRSHDHDTAETPSSIHSPGESPVLLMGGYSYGSMVTSRLPPIDQLLANFASPDASSNAAQIRLRAENLASKQNLILGSARAAILGRRKQGTPTKRGVRIGGDEGGGSPRKSHESSGRRSLSHDVEEKLRKSMDDFMAKTRPLRRHTKGTDPVTPHSVEPATPPAGGKLPAVTGLIVPRPAYLLVSPLVGLVTRLATMSLIPSALARAKEPGEAAAESKLVHNPTLAVYGDEDIFVAVQKLRAWTKNLQESQGSRFQGREIATAGHFWVEEGVLYSMRDLVDEFASSLLADGQEQHTGPP